MTNQPQNQPEFVPEWAKGIVWYQIFPERFRNGDPSNDPTNDDIQGSYPHGHNTQWQIHPWTADWYALQPYEQHTGESLWLHLQRRRYGGDLQGILDSLDYLADLGVGALYLNPIFTSPSLHKYDGATYHHVDPTLGPDPAGDKALIATETPDDPNTWVWTAADKLLLELITAVHQRGMRIIIDGVFNHMGLNSWAFRDVVEKRQQSKFKEWFKIKSWGDPETGEGFAHEGWFGAHELPELNQDENGIVSGPKEYIFAATQRWLDPDGDGDPSDGIDGWRLDVAFCVAHPFWKEWRQHVRQINPDAYLVAEIFEMLHDIRPYLQGDEFDAAMNYGFAVAAAEFFVQEQQRISVSQFDAELRRMREMLPDGVPHVMQNLFGSHDTARLATHITNRDKIIYRDWQAYHNMVKIGDSGAPLNLDAPTAADLALQKLFVIFQMTYLGAPMVYYGDEAGMWGANDPCCRKPMVWPNLTYDPEVVLPGGTERETAVPVQFNHDLHDHYRRLIAIRNGSPALQRGSFTTLLTDDAHQIYAFQREFAGEQIIVVLNRSNETQMVTLDLGGNGRWRDLLNGGEVEVRDGRLSAQIPPLWGAIFKKDSSH
ncbi:MAG: alpha-glucosidase C-terminal domain-containing protein [Ardenticatenaceae bacterium]|nr:alpha-glucosidase C-terminal domain-containing protein [Ardenticatenaceae bacterium]